MRFTTQRNSKQYKKVVKQNKDLKKLRYIVETLSNGNSLEEKYKDHSLIDNKILMNVVNVILNQIGCLFINILVINLYYF